jgi:hypothetical protein
VHGAGRLVVGIAPFAIYVSLLTQQRRVFQSQHVVSRSSVKKTDVGAGAHRKTIAQTITATGSASADAC